MKDRLSNAAILILAIAIGVHAWRGGMSHDVVESARELGGIQMAHQLVRFCASVARKEPNVADKAAQLKMCLILGESIVGETK